MHTKFWLENLKVKDNSEYVGVDVRIILTCILEKYCGMVCIGFIWLKIRTRTGNFWTRQWNFGFP